MLITAFFGAKTEEEDTGKKKRIENTGKEKYYRIITSVKEDRLITLSSYWALTRKPRLWVLQV